MRYSRSGSMALALGFPSKQPFILAFLGWCTALSGFRKDTEAAARPLAARLSLRPTEELEHCARVKIHVCRELQPSSTLLCHFASHLVQVRSNLANAANGHYRPRLIGMSVSVYSISRDGRVGVAAQQEIVLSALLCFLFHPESTKN